jgi:hypothetical protein
MREKFSLRFTGYVQLLFQLLDHFVNREAAFLAVLGKL